MTPVKKQHKPTTARIRPRKDDTPNEVYWQIIQAHHSYVLKLDTTSDKLVSEPDVRNKFFTEYKILKKIGEGAFGIVN